MNRFESTCLARIRARGDDVSQCRVLVACSGGGDSVALLALLYALRRSLGLELMVAHADHGLRVESPDDAAFVRDLCRKLDLDLVEVGLDVKAHASHEGLGIETAARELRWAWLHAEAAAAGATCVATGHTLDDHTETVFMRLARDGGAGALVPLPARQGLRWSPLIEVRREDLRAYLQQIDLLWREDASNEEDFTTRNRWRKLLAGLRTEAPALDRHLQETHRQVAELLALRDQQVAAWRGVRWDTVPGALVLRCADSETELRWILETGFRELGWTREAHLLRDLARWILSRLAWKRAKRLSWGAWTLRRESGDWWLYPNDRVD